MYTLLFSLFLTWRTVQAGLVTPSNVFTGCQTITPGGMTSVSNNGDPNGFTSSKQCNAACTSVSSINKSYYQASTGQCQCTSKYNRPPEAAAGNPDACASGNWDTRLMTTSFVFAGCYANAPGGTVNSGQTGPSGCLNSCRNSLQAGFYMGNDTTYYTCLCGPGSYTTQTQCGPGAYFLFQHSQADASAGLARRRKQERYDREQRKFIPCPKHMTACLFDGLSEDVYECVDTNNDIESCGGCRFGAYQSSSTTIGEDCSYGAALSHSNCTAGKCHTQKCKAGFKLFDGVCRKHRPKKRVGV